MRRFMPAAVSVEWIRAVNRLAMFGLASALLLGAFAVAWARFRAFDAAGAVGIDYRAFADFGRSWLATGDLYRPYQLAGPYASHDPAIVGSALTAPNFYPPPFALVGVALTVLPWVLWWAVPLGVLGWCVVSWRPAAWSWPVLALFLAWPSTSAIVIVGGSTMWAAALVAAGLRWGWPAPLILLKPSFAPLALLGIRHRSWWAAAVVLGIASAVMLPLWADYVTAMRNATGLGWSYSVGDLPLIALPVIAWLSSPADIRVALAARVNDVVVAGRRFRAQDGQPIALRR